MIEATGRGVILYTHKSLKAISITLNTHFQESVWAAIPLNSKDAMLVGVIYRSHGSSEANNDKLNQTITEAVGLIHSHFLLMGDFNYPNIKWDSESTESNTVEGKFIENIRDNFLFQHITKPTRGRLGNKSNILDLIFTNEEGMIEDVTYESPLGKSDHAVLLINHRCYTETTTYTKLKFYYNQGDYSGMSTKLEQCDWEEILGSGSVNSQWLNLKEYINVTENEFIPHSIVSGNSNKHKGKIPVSRDTITQIKKKHIAWKRYMETKNEKHYAEYCRVRNQVRTLSRKLQKQYELKLAIDAKSNPKAVWKYMNSKTKTRECVSDLNINPHDDKSRLTNSDKEKAEILGKFFSSVFTVEPSGDIPAMLRPDVQCEMRKLEVDEETIKNKLERLNVFKSVGPDGIHPRILKEQCEHLCKPLYKLFNKSLSEGQLPDDWKQAKVSAIFKRKGSRKKAGNYRPVSLTCILCKILEGCIRDHIVEHMVENNTFSKQQFGFIKGRSTVLQLLNVMDSWTKAIDNGFSTDSIYLDFIKAFDTVPHKRLIYKLRMYGISPSILDG